MKTGIVIQVRMGSTRLPGKALMPLPKNSEKVVLDRVISACLATGLQTIVATSTNIEDDAIERHYRTHWSTRGVDFYRGDPDDVLDRIYQAATLHNLEAVVRVTGDCPFVDPDVINQVVALREFLDTDYASNVDPPTWPDGLDCQVATMEALNIAHKRAMETTDRDTVMQYIVRNRREFTIANLPCPFPNMERERWVLDTEDDYEVCSELAEQLMPWSAPARFVETLKASGWVSTMAKSRGARNERYLKQRAGELAADDFRNSDRTLSRVIGVQPYGASTYSKSHVAWGKRGPLFISHGQGSRVWDIDGNEFIDFTSALGTTILGHCDPNVRTAITIQMDSGIAFPLPHDAERNLAFALANRLMPGDSQVVFGKNGSDVTSAAVRLARVVTGRGLIIAVEGGYHGWHDWALEGTSRGHGIPESNEVLRHPLAHFERFKSYAGTAAIIVEPDQFPLDMLRQTIDLARADGCLVIFDEMVTFGRYPRYTYANHHDLTPDLICIGKALGNGMPITALIGRRQHMERFVTEKPDTAYAFYSGTHFGETLSMAAAAEVISQLNGLTMPRLYDTSCKIHNMVRDALCSLNVKIGPPPLSRLTFGSAQHAAMFRQEMIANGVLVYSAFFPMLAHSDADLEHLKTALGKTFEVMARNEPSHIVPASGIMRS